MKLAFICESIRKFGGMEKITYDMYKVLSQRYEVEIFARKSCDADIKVNYFRTPDKPKTLAPIIYFLTTKKLAKDLRKRGYKIITFLRPVGDSDIYVTGEGSCRAVFFHLLKYYPFFKKLSLFSPYTFISEEIERYIIHNGLVGCVVANSVMAKNEIEKYFKPKYQVKIIRNWVDLKEYNPKLRRSIRKEWRERFGFGKDDFIMMFSAGTKLAREGFLWFVKALQYMKNYKINKNVKILIAGKRPFGYYKFVLRNLKNSPFEVLEVGPQDDLRPFFSVADLFVRPSIYNTFSTTCAESMSMGLPVLVSMFNGVSEVLEDGKNGFVVEKPYIPELFSLKMLKIISDYDIEAVGKMARETAEEEFSIERARDKLIKLLNHDGENL